MDVFVKSASQGTMGGEGYHWRPEQPECARAIESNGYLVSDYFPQLVLWGRYENGLKCEYTLYVSSLISPFTDTHGRPIKHTILWQGAKEDEALLRTIIIRFLHGDLGKAVAPLINLDDHGSFTFDVQALGRVGVLEATLAKPILRPFRARDLPPADLLGVLQSNLLPGFYKMHLEAPEGVLLAIGKGFSLAGLKAHGLAKHVRWACDFSPEEDRDGI